MKVELHLDDALLSAFAQEVVERLKPLLATRKGDGPVDVLIGVPELAEYLGGVSTDWIYQRTSKNEIPFIKVGHLIRFRRFDIDKWLATHSVPAVNPLSALLAPRKSRDSESLAGGKST
jgi:excisionase family DNA binding protein